VAAIAASVAAAARKRGSTSEGAAVWQLATRDEHTDLTAGAGAKANVVELLEEERARKLIVGGQSHIARP
jgi:hypothetical protein